MKIFKLAAALIVIITMIGCEKKDAPTDEGSAAPAAQKVNTKKLALATIAPLAFFAGHAAGVNFEVQSLMPAGADPHTWEPTAADLIKLAKADILVRFGVPGLGAEEAFLAKLSEHNPDIFIIDAAFGLELLPDDPHVWLSFANANRIVSNIGFGFCKFDRANCGAIRSNMAGATIKISMIEKEVRKVFIDTSIRAFIVDHPAWGYLARDLDLLQIPIESEGKEPGPARIAEVIEQAKSSGALTILLSKPKNRQIAESIAAEIHGQVIEANPLAENWFELMRRIPPTIILGKTE